MNISFLMELFCLVAITGFSSATIGLAQVREGQEPKKFPNGFQWCVATSAHQIEGNNVNSDWWAFESEPGRIKHGEHSGAACDHWNRLDEDIKLMKDLGVTTYRFSVEWAKIELQPGQFDLGVIEHYRQELKKLRAAQIKPLVTLHHFTLPLWVAKQGGFEWTGFPEAFRKYTGFVFEHLGSQIEDYITINEPMVLVTAGFFDGNFPPAKHDIPSGANAARQLVLAHAKSYHELHDRAAKTGQHIRVGIAHHLRIFDPASRYNPLDRFMAGNIEKMFNWAFMDAVDTGHLKVDLPFTLHIDETYPEAAHTQDFIGLNYYSRDNIKFVLKGPAYIERLIPNGAPTNDLGWEIYPEGFYRILKDIVDRYGHDKPIIITENGLADGLDDRRGAFLRDHLAQLHRAISEGINVEGYCHWSFMDNFEWAEGFAPRFGLYEVNYKSMERRLRPSATLFIKAAKENQVP